jgi:hypothetical protein
MSVKFKMHRKTPSFDTPLALIALVNMRGQDGYVGEMASKLYAYYNEVGELSEKQRQFVYVLSRTKKKTRTADKNYSLYAISDGRNVKIGFSHNPKARLRELQTGCPAKLSIEWTLDIGGSKSEAMKQEGKLHRFCRKHKLRGEWFKGDCMLLVNQFGIKHKAIAAAKEQSDELQIVCQASERI